MVHFQVAHGQSDIYMQRGIRFSLGQHINLKRKVLILSDEGIPFEYVKAVQKQCLFPYVKIVPHGERSKSLRMVDAICRYMQENGFGKDDLLFAVGGGMIGDLGGFTASIYLQGIPVASLPTTTLSQIDSSIGGKTAVNMEGVKNVVGTFYQPSQVFIDLNTLATLPKRAYYSGIVEAVKAGMIYDEALFQLFVSHEAGFQEDAPPYDMEEIIERSLYVKRDIVEQDEKEQGIRKLLNFGHTLGHAVESIYMGRLYHGECVGLGMLMILENQKLRESLKVILKKMGMPVKIDYTVEEVISYALKDKKYNGSHFTIAQVDQAGKGYLKEVTPQWLRKHMEGNKL